MKRKVYELGDVGEKALNSNLPLKLGFTKKILHASFSNDLLKNIKVESTFPYVMLPRH
jgi:hypothetical protein